MSLSPAVSPNQTDRSLSADIVRCGSYALAFAPRMELEWMNTPVYLQTITSQTPYRSFSLEELRLLDYRHKSKAQTQSATYTAIEVERGSYVRSAGPTEAHYIARHLQVYLP